MTRPELCNLIINTRKIALKCAFYDDKMTKHFVNADSGNNGTCFTNLSDDLLMLIRPYMAIPNFTPDGRINKDEAMINVDWTNKDLSNEQFIRKYEKYFT